MKGKDFDQPALLTPGQAATILGVDPKTVSRWAKAGKLASTRTLGNHRRYKEEDVFALRDRTDDPGTGVVEPDVAE